MTKCHSSGYARIALVCTPTELNLEDKSTLDNSSYGILNSAFNCEEIVLVGQAGIASSVQQGMEQHVYSDGQTVIAFSGTLLNFENLMSTYMKSDSPVSNIAQLLCVMFKQMNPRKLANILKGEFTFILFDTVQMRAMAVRDGSGTIPLKQGQFENGSIIVTNFDFEMPKETTNLLCEVPAGNYIFGWKKLSISHPITPVIDVCSPSTLDANVAAQRALEGILTSRPHPLKVAPSTKKLSMNKIHRTLMTLSPPPVRFDVTASEFNDRKIPTLDRGLSGRSDRSSWWRRDEVSVKPLQTKVFQNNLRKSPLSKDSNAFSKKEGRSGRKRVHVDRTASKTAQTLKQEKIPAVNVTNESSLPNDVTKEPILVSKLTTSWHKSEIEEAVRTLHRIASDLVLKDQEDVMSPPNTPHTWKHLSLTRKDSYQDVTAA
mmetsp:Transcript_35957/g.49919  ORF Transcript_35957/g.49919 Transcript_35957/m.49919 type:complete len:431 (-) Transcript_35957:159-1451(-)|eukprot:CAMPEP_0196581360 /NCGR_PEP_ID=MMETSP1081-20130531/33766_1 /TAXON_ID=36882 /ORGANISM="Pyramimonas amylifera, Strain CCMP720" /LENGTH=430 /DNA_ID=CAMNT_0041901563 /DNA_START=150 /DNA_END=1442 /DNA_ORIENTATION=+